MDKIKRHEQLCTQIHNIYKSKNMAYGDSFGQSFNDWGVSAAAIRITDKFNRFINLAKHPEIESNDDWSREIQTYKKMGVAVYHVNPGICVYKNNSLTKSNLPSASGSFDANTNWYELS